VENKVRSLQHLEIRQQRIEALAATAGTLLSTQARITLEIGSGHGHYLTAYAAAHPAEYCVGIDIILDRLHRSDRKRARAGLSNLHFIRAEAFDFLAVLPPHTRLEKIFVLFPDPWPKRRHHKNRLMQPAFLEKLATHAAPGAHLYFRTDHEDYFAAATAALKAQPRWEVKPGADWPFELATVFQVRAQSHQSCVARLRD
jgi:tRNA (guanine-N7-)-methyltransferase